jgi:hypothetical protein
MRTASDAAPRSAAAALPVEPAPWTMTAVTESSLVHHLPVRCWRCRSPWPVAIRGGAGGPLVVVLDTQPG